MMQHISNDPATSYIIYSVYVQCYCAHGLTVDNIDGVVTSRYRVVSHKAVQFTEVREGSWSHPHHEALVALSVIYQP